MLETVEVETGGPLSGSVIWLHGLGADGHDFEPIVPALRLPSRGLRFVFPHAPVRPVTLNAGMRMRAWFDIVAIDREAPQDEPGIRESASEVDALIAREEQRGIRTESIVLAGFSQGGAIALHAALRHSRRLAGVLALSTYLPLPGTLEAEAHEANRRTPVFIGHGTEDPLVPLALGEATRDLLLEQDYDVSWNTYEMAHEVSLEEVTDIRDWLSKMFHPPL